MRQNQKSNRSRGRGGRKGPNPLTRSYESNGPDVKVRGSAQHVAEKYMTLARDALSAGDGIAAENYFQHAEHYNRIIMSAQSQINAARDEERKNSIQMNENTEQPRSDRSDEETQGHLNGQPESQNEEGFTSHSGGEDGEGQSVQVEEARKPRGRRPVGRGRPRAHATENSGKEEAEPEAKEAKPTSSEDGDKISDNPPAFLMSE